MSCSVCGQKLRRHCNSPTCTWLICRLCRRYGDPRAGRWAKAAS